MSLPTYADEAVKFLRKACPVMRQTITKIGPFTPQIQRPKSPFLALMRAIIYQQLSGKAANTIHTRLVALFPAKNRVTAANLQALDLETLRSAGVSRNKGLALHDLAAKTLEGVVPKNLAKLEMLSDQEIIARLTQVRGIGRWTVEMLLLGMGRPDVMPIDDLGIRKGYMLAAGLSDLPKPKELEAIAEKWRPWRSVASWYCWRSVDQVAS